MNFDIRVATCLAVLAISAACSTTPDAPTAPSATQAAPSAAGADGTTLKFNAPALVTPVDGARAEDRRPTLVWANAQSKYGGIGVAYDLEVETATASVYKQTVGETPDFGQHLLPFDLEFDTVYFWRVRARNGDEFGPFSAWAEFLSPSRPTSLAPTIAVGGPSSCAAPLSPMGPGETRKPRPNHSSVLRGIVAANPSLLARSCQEHGGSWEFLDRSIDALRSIDGRYGYNAKRGNMNDPSVDVVSYFWGNHTEFQGSSQVYIFDVIGGHCGSFPSVSWSDVTDVTYGAGSLGRTMYPRPGRLVQSVSCATAGQ